MDPELQAVALLHVRAPSDIVSGNRARIDDGDQMIHMDETGCGGRFGDPTAAAAGQDRRAAEASSGYGARTIGGVALTRDPRGIAGRDCQGQRVRLGCCSSR